MHEAAAPPTDADLRVIEDLVEERARVDCDVIPIDDDTWAIHGSIAVDGNAILAEFHSRADAEAALEQIAVTVERRSTVVRSEGPMA